MENNNDLIFLATSILLFGSLLVSYLRFRKNDADKQSK